MAKNYEHWRWSKLIVLVLYKKAATAAAAACKSPDTKLRLDIYTYMSGARKSTWRNGKSNFKLNELTYTVYQLYTYMYKIDVRQCT